MVTTTDEKLNLPLEDASATDGLIDDIHQWNVKNFGEQPWQIFAAGIIEEVGELSHGILKRHQNIRMEEEHNAKIRDSLADIFIYLAGICKMWDLHPAYTGVSLDTNDPFYLLIQISIDANKLLEIPQELPKDQIDAVFVDRMQQHLNKMITHMSALAQVEGFDLPSTITDVWENEVSVRDWTETSAIEDLEPLTDKAILTAAQKKALQKRATRKATKE